MVAKRKGLDYPVSDIYLPNNDGDSEFPVPGPGANQGAVVKGRRST